MGIIESITSIGSRVTNLGQWSYNITNQSRAASQDWDVTMYHPIPQFVTLDQILAIEYFSCTPNFIHCKMNFSNSQIKSGGDIAGNVVVYAVMS